MSLRKGLALIKQIAFFLFLIPARASPHSSLFHPSSPEEQGWSRNSWDQAGQGLSVSVGCRVCMCDRGESRLCAAVLRAQLSPAACWCFCGIVCVEWSSQRSGPSNKQCVKGSRLFVKVLVHKTPTGEPKLISVPYSEGLTVYPAPHRSSIAGSFGTKLLITMRLETKQPCSFCAEFTWNKPPFMLGS